jgi:hypothetical protein
VSVLRAVLAEIRTAADAGEVDLDSVAGRLGIGRDELDAMVDYWVGRGRLSLRELGCRVTDCPLGSCAAGCRLGPMVIGWRDHRPCGGTPAPGQTFRSLHAGGPAAVRDRT